MEFRDCDYSRRLFTIAIDIGGSLAKVVFSPLDSGLIYFDTVETARIELLLALLDEVISKYNGGDHGTTQIVATGGGAFKFNDLIVERFPGVHNFSKFEEMEGLAKGLDFFIHQVRDEVFTYTDLEGEKIVETVASSPTAQPTIYPYMLVNIGSGVSMLKVDAPNVFTRVGGSSLGGGTLWGLLSLITGAQSYDEMLNWAQAGDNTHVDMLVGDIYGTDYNKIGLKSTHIASSFGKVFQDRNHHNLNNGKCMTHSQKSTNGSSADQESDAGADAENEQLTCTNCIKQRNKSFKNEDICKSLLYAVSNNIGQIAYLQAKIHNVQNIYFGGSYIRGHLTTMNTLSYAINFWTESSKQAFFLKHEGFLGAMGAFLDALELH